MKRRSPVSVRRLLPFKAGGNRPTPGWKGTAIADGWVNPRPPALPATLHLTLEAYYTGCAMIGILAAQTEQPDLDWVSNLAIAQGTNTAAKIKRERKRR